MSENDVLITKRDEVCDIFNNYFVNVAKNIGKHCAKVDDSIFILDKNNFPLLNQ